MIIGNIDRLDADTCAGWVMDTASLDRRLTIALMVDGQEKYVETASLERSDLLPIHGSAFHGFSFGTSPYLKKGKNTLDVRVMQSDFTFPGTPKVIDDRDQRDFVQIGQDGWLFLQNDSNNVTGLLKGEQSLSAADVSRLRRMLLRRYDTIRAMGAVCATYVVPEKGAVCNALRLQPLALSPNRAAVQVSAALADVSSTVFSYGLAMMEANATPSAFYLRTDTHISGAGQKAVFADVMALLGLSDTIAWSNAPDAEFTGDLGNKLSPPQTEAIVRWTPKYHSVTVVDEVSGAIENGGKLRGKRIFHESDAANELTCALIGTSSAFYLREAFFARFRYVHYYWDNVVDDDYLRSVNPDFVVCLITERLLSSTLTDNSISIEPLKA